MVFAFWILVSLARTVFLSPFMVEGDSMLPTIHNGAIFMVDKISYKYGDPQRDDIIVFTLREDPSFFYVKRVIGLPGDNIHLDSDGVYLVDAFTNKRTKLAEPYVFPEKYQPAQFLSTTNELGQDFTVPAGKYFVLGDNRQHSKDSRYFYNPFIPREQIVGKYGITLYDPHDETL